MNEYTALLAYIGVTLVVFVGALVWKRCGAWIKRRLNIEDYQRHTPDKDHHANTAHGHSI